MQVQSREGPAVGLEMSALYRLNSDSAAKGIVDFQKIVAAGISEQLLRWKGIEAKLKIAESKNTKAVIVGGGKDGLPVILDTK